MPLSRQISTTSPVLSRRFAGRLGLFYGAVFALSGTHLPFFPVWLRAIGVDAAWIGIIIAVPAVTRFTVLPLITSLAERRQALRGALRLTTFATASGFTVLGLQHQPWLVLLVYVGLCSLWTPVVPLTDAYALRGVMSYGLNYGRLRLWGSAAFIVGTLLCGGLADVVPAPQLIWIIVALALCGAASGLLLQPLPPLPRSTGPAQDGRSLLGSPRFLCIIAASALIQGSHAAYYTFSAIEWKAQGLSGLTIAWLWTMGVLAEIILFALSPRFTLSPAILVVIGAVAAVLRWVLTAQEPHAVGLAAVQISHGFTFGLTLVGTMGLLVREVPAHLTARGQGYYSAASGVVGSAASILSGPLYAAYGPGVYYAMAAMAGLGGALMWLGRARLSAQPHKA
ncbi:putative Permease of the major facilitator superfamily; 3-phenylpropionic acid transporter [Bradyrhizobium sp. ORS 375]|uniref:MFS transporter n=1 Tax=Bradyrhizobium sp. (strain ORS 375) TaxID=566679 RepID=UPI000240631A|nr:MFS transporter [Bradyrhizobium sp. ORS 375]CCD91871.1 putative Permease of the major facilitator superfamily; 3-phenylpropionic acid transporter [Bradyrhizobium sp. ORS 375]